MLSVAHRTVTGGMISEICLLSSNCSTSIYAGVTIEVTPQVLHHNNIPHCCYVRLSEQSTAGCFAMFARSILQSPCGRTRHDGQ